VEEAVADLEHNPTTGKVDSIKARVRPFCCLRFYRFQIKTAELAAVGAAVADAGRPKSRRRCAADSNEQRQKGRI
jgi:hypothetical protein